MLNGTASWLKTNRLLQQLSELLCKNCENQSPFFPTNKARLFATSKGVNMKTSISLLLLFTVGFYIEHVHSQKCRSMNADRNYRLVNHTIGTIEDVSPGTCTDSCAKHSDCYSINYIMTSHRCELNNATKRFHGGDVVNDENSFYMSILERDYDPCVVIKPCQNNGNCSVHWSNDSYSCQCPKPYKGRDCGILKSNGDLHCQNKVINLSQNHSLSWKANILGSTSLSLTGCNPVDVANTNELFLFVSKGDISDYGKYEIVKVKENAGCTVTLVTPMKMTMSSSPCAVVAQRFPNFDSITLTQSCTLTCNPLAADGLGGIMALRASELVVDSTSKIDMNYKGYHGGSGGNTAGAGGNGGQTFACTASNYGKGGNYHQNGAQGGGAGDGAAGGPGGLNAGGGGGDSTTNSDDGAGGGGGGGHFSGGGGGGAGSGCSGQRGGSGGTASTLINSYAGGGGKCGCPGANGGNGGLSGGTHGNNLRGGMGGTSTCGSIYGGGGGGGGFQYGNMDFTSRLSYGGGGGGGGGSRFGYAGGRGGQGGGLVLLFVDKMTLNGKIEAKGEKGQCQPVIYNHRGGSGGSGAGGSVVIVAKQLVGTVTGKIGIQGGPALAANACGVGPGAGGGGGFGRWVVQTSSALHKSG